MKKAIWTALVAGTTALSASLALRLLDRVWRRATHESPPETPRWARLLVAWPIRKTVTQTVQPDSVD